MKKIAGILILAVIVYTTGFSFTANAASSSNGSITLGNGITVTLSSNVSAGYKATDSAFAAVTKHLQGDKEYGTASDLGKIVYKDASVAASVTDSDLSAGNSSAFDSSWAEVGQ